MRICWLSLLTLVVLLGGTVRVPAEERYLEFLEGLRSRGYYDYAMLYLDQLQERTDLPDDVRRLLPYEKGKTLLASAQTLASPELQTRQLDQAIGFFDQFAKENPNHPKAGEANSQRAGVLLGKARVEIWQSRSPSNHDNRAAFQKRARTLIQQARQTFRTAHDQHKARYESFPTFIDRDEDRRQYEERARAESAYILAQFHLARCTYEESQTYDPGSEQYKKLLTQAANEFEDVHSRYRTMLGGLHARMWQGKCFEEQGDITKAMGIYNELLGHPGADRALQELQDQVRQFRLICLNNDQRKDYQLVVAEASMWLTEARGARERSLVGQGIRWERALAFEQLANNRENSPVERERLLRQALADVRFINRYPGQYQDPSMFMIQRLQVALRGKDAGDPEDFDTAYGMARNMVVKELGEKNEALEAAQKAKKSREEIAKLQQDRRLHLQESARMLNLALSLVEDETEPRDVNRARYFLAYVNLLLRKNYEAAILGEFVGRHFAKEAPQTAQDSAYLAMAAYIQAYNESPEDQKTVDLRLMKRVSTLLTSTWPNSDRANEARMNMGRMYAQMDQPVEAAKWYSQIPETASQYTKAQMAAGQAFWTAYLNTAILPDQEKPPLDELSRWQQSAEKFLRTGIGKVQKTIPTTGAAPEEMIAAKVSLVQIILNKGDYKAAIAVLTKDPHPVMQAVAVKDESQRPQQGVKSRDFASLAHQLLLRAYVGTQQLDQARAAMKELEKVAGHGGGDGEAVTQIYVQLGQELEKELRRLKSIGDTQRVAEVRKSFETFLNDMFSRQDQTYGSLAWVAETYYGLAQGSEEEPAQADAYYDKAAAAYQSILDRGAELNVEAGQLTGVKMRLVNCKRHQGRFETAANLVAEILQSHPDALSAQMEAAYVMQKWAESGQGDSWKKFDEAIQGGKIGDQQVEFWGWADIGLRLQRLIMMQADARERYHSTHVEARYNVAECRRLYGLAQSADKERNAELERALFEINAFVAIAGEIDDESWAKFDALYQQIQTDLGRIPDPLERPKEYVAVAAPADSSEKTEAAPKQAVAATAARNPAPESGTSMAGVIVVLVLFCGGIGAWFYNTKKNQKRKSPAAYAMGGAPAFVPPGEARPRKVRSAKAATARKASSEGVRPRKPKPPAEAGDAPAARPRRRPSPPSES